jgi:hypothetical protein
MLKLPQSLAKGLSIEGILGQNTKQKPPANDSNSQDSVTGPWKANAESLERDSFFPSINIQGSRWAKLYPYRLVVVKLREDGSYSVLGSENSGSEKSVSLSLEAREDLFRLNYEPLTQSKWVYHLPITPQQLSISNQFAINTSSTLRGIVEEHNGTKFKLISMSGTFGVWPFRGSRVSAPKPETSIQTLFGGTINAFSALSSNINRTIDILKGKNPAKKPETPQVSNTSSGFAGTGYAQALLLDQFLEQYSERKKRPDWADCRLALDIPKQNQTFLVTPVVFTYSQSADSPNEYKFNLQLKAYRRINLATGSSLSVIQVPKALGANNLQKILRGIGEARRALGSAYNLVRAVRSDFNAPFNALREVSLFIKGLSGLAASIADLPENIILDAKFAIADALSNINQANTINSSVSAKIAKDLSNIKLFKAGMEGFISNADQNSLSSKTSPINNLFENIQQNFDLFDQLDTNSVSFSFSIQNAIENEINRVSLLTVDDIQRHRNTIQELVYQISNAFGTGDQTFSNIYGRATPKTRLQPITIDEYSLLKKLYDVIQLMGVLTLNDDVQQNQNAAYEFVKAEANSAGITFEDSQSKIRAPVPFGLTIEQIAARYLGNSERWLEIVTINALKAPYIDEVGFERLFLSNGNGRQFNVSSAENLYVGQKIYLSSNTQPKQKRTIINIEKINDTNFLITVDGLDNLDIFTLAHSAKMKAYLPGTVNSQDQIFIPSNLPVSDDLVTRPVPATKDDELTGLSKIDLLLADNGDLAVDAFGDLRLSYGLTNIYQALKLKFITEPGQLLRFPNFGSGLRPGVSTADLDAKSVYNIISALIAQDPRFAGIEKLQITKEGAIFTVNLSVFIANGLGVYPISFKLVG